MSDILEIQRIFHRFGGLQVLRGVNFAVGKGSITGLIGPNGAGKSTLFNIISGFLRPTEGDIIESGKSITHLTVQQRSYSGLIRTFQTPQVFSHLTVRENLIAGYYMHGRTGVIASLMRFPGVHSEFAESARVADEMCAEFGLEPVRDQLAGQLPTGQQRLVELARAAVSRPRLLYLDEPSAGLSAQEVAELMRTLQRLNGMGVTILLVSHDMGLMGVSMQVHVLCFGEIIASGSMSEVHADPRVREAYLGA
jgi:branched-chain amino acid transport system ATP-binding protein